MELYPLKTKQNEQIELLEMRASFGITFRPFSIIIDLRNNFLFISMRSNSLAFFYVAIACRLDNEIDHQHGMIFP